MNPLSLNLNTPRRTREILALTLIIALLLTGWVLSSFLWDKYRVVRDVQNFYWMARAQDPSLFARDYLYISTNQIIEANILGYHFLIYPLSLGYGLFFYVGSMVLDYVWLTKLSVLVLVPLCVVYLFKTGQFLRDNLTGVSLSLIFMFLVLASPLSTSIVSGLQRAFALPLLIIFIYYLIRKQYLGAAVLIFISTLVYLPNFPPMVIAYMLLFVKVEPSFKFSLKITRSSLGPLVGSLAFSALVVALALAVQLQLISSPPSAVFAASTTDTVSVLRNPSYQASGSTPLFIGFPFLGRAGIFDTGGDVTNFLVMLIMVVLIYRTLGSNSLRRVPYVLWALLLAGFIMYVVSLIFVFGLSSFALYLPSRYTRSTIFLFMLFYVGLNWVDFLREFPVWLRRNVRLLIFFVLTLSLALGIVYLLSPNRGLMVPTFLFLGIILGGILTIIGGSAIFWLATTKSALQPLVRWGSFLVIGTAVLVVGTNYIRILGVKTTNPSEYERNVYEYVAHLPKDTLLAGDPDIMTNIPLFSKRSVLFRELFPRSDVPIVEYFDAQYAESTQPVLDFCRRYQVGYLVLDTRAYSPDHLAEKKFFYQPWNDRIVDLVSDRSNFVLTQIQPVYSSGPFAVIKCDGTMTRQLSAAD